MRKYYSPDAKRCLSELLDVRKYEVIHVEGHYLLPLVPKAMWQSVILVEHNIESDLYRQKAALAESLRDKVKLTFQATMTQWSERKVWRNVAMTVAITDNDATAMQRGAHGVPVVIVPNGADHLTPADPQRDNRQSQQRPTLVFVGNFAYEPNLDAVRA
jgi:glycosyltransferase involved in cell wall biosynthesis